MQETDVQRCQNRSPTVATEDARMMRDPLPVTFTDVDRQVFQALVPAEHYLRQVSVAVDFERFRSHLTTAYSPDQGRPAEDPVRMLKLEFLRSQYGLSDRQVIERAETDAAFRWFMGLSLEDTLPDPSSLCYFRGRQGVEGFRSVFNELLGQAHEQGMVKNRLRLKDATHVIADVAVPTTLALLAQMRDRLLRAAEPFDTVRVEGDRANIEMLRAWTASGSDEERLAVRVTHLREILAWVDELPPPEDLHGRAWQVLLAARQLAHKILGDQDDPKGGDRTRSVVDPDARRSKHGIWYDGYLLDTMMDADSELITAIDVLPANGNEGGNAAELVRQEEEAHGNDIEALSIDGAGFQGSVLRELEDPAGLNLDVYVPPKKEQPTTTFTPRDFAEEKSAGTTTCPAGETSRYRQRNHRDTGWVYRFVRATCERCPLLGRCMSRPPTGTFGRTVHKNDYEVEYQRVREKAQAPAYAAVRTEHPKIERKLSELVRRHGARRARSRGQPKVLCQALMAAVATNVKRLVHLLRAPTMATAPA